MKLKVIWWYFLSKDKYRTYKILCWIKAAKELYLKGSIKGLCQSLTYTVPDIFIKEFYKINMGNQEKIKSIIPEYYPEYFRTILHPNDYWWDISDRKSRIQAFDKLIQVYEDKLK